MDLSTGKGFELKPPAQNTKPAALRLRTSQSTFGPPLTCTCGTGAGRAKAGKIQIFLIFATELQEK
jgi:hypothetical protein